MRDLEASVHKALTRGSYIDRVRELVTRDTTDSIFDGNIARQYCESIKQLQPVRKIPHEAAFLDQVQEAICLAVIDLPGCNKTSFRQTPSIHS